MIEPNENFPNRLRETASTCPYIGVPHDPETHFAFPHVANFCHRVNPPEPVRLDYQRTHCMSTKYWDCQLMQENWSGRMPAQLRGEDTRPIQKRVRRSSVWHLVVVVIILAVILLSLFLLLGQPKIKQSIQLLFGPQANPVQVVAIATISPPATPTPQPATAASVSLLQPAPTLPGTETPTPAPTVTVAPTAGPALETPFGPQGEFLLHTVLAGESLQSLAQAYSTSVEVLVAANDTVRAQQTSVAVLGSANVQVSNFNLWPGTVVVILPGKTDPTGVPRLRWFILEQDAHLDDLAEWLAVPVGELRYYNDLGEGEWIPTGRWMIAPVAEGPVP